MADSVDESAAGPLPIVYRDSTDSATFYEAVWGRVFNQRRDTARQPRAVVRASQSAHVKAAVELAEQGNCRVSVRSGGHSWAAWSVRDDAILLDLAGLRDLEYDDQTEIVTCSPSRTGREINGFLAEKGRMFPGGHCPDVGLGGFLLQGGMGWNCKNWGWACEYIVGIYVVTADARELHCSAEENVDLFWAVRGSGPGFPGIVTRFYLQTRPLLKMFNCLYIYPVSEYRKILQWVIDVCPTADPDTEVVCVSNYAPGEDEIQVMAGFTTFQKSKANAEKVMKAIHDGRPGNAKVELFCDPTSLAKEYHAQEVASPENHRYCCDNAYIANEADVPTVLEAAFTTLPNKKSFSLYFAMNPTSRRALPGMALSMQSDHYFAAYTTWEDAADDGPRVDWVRRTMRDMEPHSLGSYMGDSDFQARGSKFWSEENWKKLMEIRRKWDPKGRFCGYLDHGDKSGIDGLRNEFWTVG